MERAKDVKSYVGLIRFLENKGAQRVRLTVHNVKNPGGHVHKVEFEVHGRRLDHTSIMTDEMINQNIRAARCSFFMAMAEECETFINRQIGRVS